MAAAVVVTPDLLDTLRSDRNLPDDVWYLVTATVLCILNRPEEIPIVYEHAVGPGHGSHGLPNGSEPVGAAEQLRIARRLREALLKTSAIGGMPKVRTHMHATEITYRGTKKKKKSQKNGLAGWLTDWLTTPCDRTYMQ